MNNTMKRKATYSGLALVLGLALLAGCDSLDVQPTATVTEDLYWQRPSDAEAAVNAAYAELDGTTMVKQLDGVTDLAYRASSGPGTLHDVGAGNITASNDAISGIWDGYYEGVRKANDVIANIGKIETGDQGLLRRIEAEARFLRAYFYTQLTSLWGDVPLITEPIPITEQVPRTAKDEVVDFVISELDGVINSNALPVSYTGENVGRATHGAALALKARVALRNSRWAVARDAAKAVMDLEVYDLYPDYGELFMYAGQSSSEVIFDRQYTQGGDTYDAFGYAAASLGGSSVVEPTHKLYLKYEFTGPQNPDDPYENIDPRWDATVYYTGQPIGNSIYDSTPTSTTQDRVSSTEASTDHGYNLKKWVDYENDNANPDNGSINMILIRYADVLLMYAEAKVELGEIDPSVYDALNQIRQRPSVDLEPISPATHPDQQSLRQYIRDERARELAFEGLRLYDLNRWQMGEEKAGQVYGAHFPDGSGGWYLQTIGFDRSFNPNRDYLWPIPLSEMNSNTAITSNNPGY